MEMNKAKKIKRSSSSKTKKVNVNDDVVEKIISFLPIKKSAEFSLLSTRFENTWCQNRVFAFGKDFARARTTEDLSLIISRAFRDHLGTKIEHFSLYMDPNNLDHDLVRHWIEEAIRKGVENLELDFTRGTPNLFFELHFSNRNAESLKILKLHNCRIDIPIQLQGLRNLKHVYLQRVIIHSYTLIGLFSCCLKLESLELLTCFTTQVLSFSVQNLKHFKVLRVDNCKYISSIDIYARSLCSLYFRGEFCAINIQTTLPELDDVVLDFKPNKGFQNVSQVKQLIMGLVHVKTLRVSHTVLEGFSPKIMNGKLSVPEFCLWFLKEIHITIGISFINPYDIVSFLKNCPNLERIFIDLGESIFESGYYWETQAKQRLEECNPRFENLKIMKVKGFKFQKVEMEMIKFFLEKGNYLEKVALICSKNNKPNVDSPEAALFFTQLMCWRKSGNVKIQMFEHLNDKSYIYPVHSRSGKRLVGGS